MPTIDRLVATGKIPSCRIGWRRVFDPVKVQEAISTSSNGRIVLNYAVERCC